MVCSQKNSSGKQEMQTDGGAEVNASIPVSVVGPGLSTTAAQQHQACHRHQKIFKARFGGGK